MADLPLRGEALEAAQDAYITKTGRVSEGSRVDYSLLAEWFLEREGQVMVCEQAGAEWLPFELLASIKSAKGLSIEVLWRNEKQLTLGGTVVLPDQVALLGAICRHIGNRRYLVPNYLHSPWVRSYP